jgi:hypothetical protein
MEASSPRQEFPTTDVRLDSEVEACWDLAAWIGQLSSDDHLRSFTSLLIALLHSENGLSKWFLRYARATDIALEQIYESRQFRPASLQLIKERRSKGEVASGKPDWTVSVNNIVTGAIKLMNSDSNSQLGIRHLLGAYFYELPSAHEKQMIAWGFDRQREASALVRQIRERYPSELEQWTRTHTSHFSTGPDLKSTDPILRSRISGFAADTPEGEDQLNIEDDVYALSALICSTRVSPPLSVGLFGDWGSGKSFFIRQLQKGVSWITQQARQSGRMQKDVPFYKHVVQIEFNAWNYAEGNLWAALVQHILENLRLSDDPKDKDLVAARRAHLQKQMELEQQVRATATTKQTEAQKRLDDATDELQNLRDRHEEQVKQLKEVMATDVLQTMQLEPETEKQINDLRTQLGLERVEGSAGEFLSALEGARGMLRRTSAVFEYVPTEQRQRFLLMTALVLLGPPVVAIVVGLLGDSLSSTVGPVASFAGWLSTTLAAGAAWLRDRTKHLNSQVAQIEKLQQHARQRVEAEQQAHKAEAVQLEQRIALVKDEVLAAQAKQQEALSRLEQIQAQLAATTPASVLADFVRARSQSEDYRKYLGLPAVIRRDFESISRMVAQENAELDKKTSLGEETANSDHRINRIVLYIDDLDRCTEQLVVEVLKAVHLLLAFPLFVVVVAVDARWVSRSLAQRFPGLLTAAKDANPSEPVAATTGNATPNDYLEKIFQIPFWLQQPTEESVKRMLRGLMKEGLTGGANGPKTDGGGKVPDTGEKKAQPDAVFKRRQHDPNARALDIQPKELDHIERLAPLLDRSPRALKRFVNVYRLMKASLPPEEQDAFLEQDGPLSAPFETVLLLLAIVNGLPNVSDILLQALLSSPASNQDPNAKSATLETIIAGSQTSWRANAKEEMARLTGWLDRNVGVGWKTADPARFLTWVPRVARYAYHLHRSTAQ